jgi:hypothetical protein
MEEIPLCTDVPCPRTDIMKYQAQIEKILAAHGDVKSFDALSEENGRKAIQAAITAGQELQGVRDLLKHGEFTPWLEANITDISPETVRRYMRLAANASLPLLADCTSLRQAYLATGIIKAASPAKARTTGTAPTSTVTTANGATQTPAGATANPGTTANGATQAPAGATGFSPAVILSPLSIPLAEKPALSELVASVMEHLNGLTNDEETKAAIFALAPCVAWHNKESGRLLETLPQAA